MRQVGLLALVAVLAVLAGFGARRLLTTRPVDDDAPPVLEFELTALDGPVVSASDYEGEVVVIDLWATWCGPCRVQAKILHELELRYAKAPVSFLAIDVGEPEAMVRDFILETPLSHRVLIDPAETMMTRYSLYALPTVLVAAGDGTITFLRQGISDGKTVGNAIDRALAAAG